MSVECSHVRTLHVYCSTFAIVLVETSSDTFEADTTHVNVVGKVYDYVTVSLTVIDGVS